MSTSDSTVPKSCIVVTGGAGFLGRKITHLLRVYRGDVYHTIRVFDCSFSEWDSAREADEAEWAGSKLHSETRLEMIEGDVRNLETLVSAFQGVQVVIHTAACVGFWSHSAEEMYDINTQGTLNVIQACLICGVTRLIFTSSFCVVLGLGELEDGQKYPERFVFGDYARTKALAEQAVLNSNGKTRPILAISQGSHAGSSYQPLSNSARTTSGNKVGDQRLKTCVIRALSMYGEGDPWKVPSLIKYTAGGWIIRLGNSRHPHQQAYVGNIAWAHVCAADRLLAEQKPLCIHPASGSHSNANAATSADIAGKVYTPDDNTPLCSIYDALQPVLESAGCHLTTWSLPFGILYVVGCVLEFLCWVLRPVIALRCPLNRTTALAAACSGADAAFRGEAARKDLGYYPLYTYDEAIERTRNYLRCHCPKGLSSTPTRADKVSFAPSSTPSCSPTPSVVLNQAPWEPSLPPWRSIVGALISMVWLPLLICTVYFS